MRDAFARNEDRIMFKSAILGCRGRARGHARAYEHVKRGKIAAICDLNEELLNSFGEEFGIQKRYTDIHEMLDKERPDLLHIVTAPLMRDTLEPLRYPLLDIASEHEVPGAIVEKPVAVKAEDWRDLLALSKRQPDGACLEYPDERRSAPDAREHRGDS